jgi:site-specific recombinase XerD
MSDDVDTRDMSERNRELLSQFRAYLESRNLSDRTVNKHVPNIDFFINEFLLYDDYVDPREGIESVDYFLGFWFIKKAMWASESTIKENITSLKHFYTFMHQKGEITKEELDNLKQLIKESKEDWLETLRKYEDVDVDFDDIW